MHACLQIPIVYCMQASMDDSLISLDDIEEGLLTLTSTPVSDSMSAEGTVDSQSQLIAGKMTHYA